MASETAQVDFSGPATGKNSSEGLRDMLVHQADAIWPQESDIIKKYNLPENACILDLGCGSGEICARLADLFPTATIHGIDIEDANVEISKKRCKEYGDRVSLFQADGTKLPIADGAYDLVVIRSVLQAAPERQGILNESMRVIKKDGLLHVLGEDYGMLYAYPCNTDAVDTFLKALIRFYDSSGCDGRLFRKLPSMMLQIPNASLTSLQIQYIMADTQRCSRNTIASIFREWKAGWMEIVAQGSGHTPEELGPGYDALVSCCENPIGYVCWQLMVATIKKEN